MPSYADRVRDILKKNNMYGVKSLEEVEAFCAKKEVEGEKIVVYTDGSALDNGSKTSGCGWAYKIIYKGHEVINSGGAVGATNNQMEMTAILKAMQSITDKSAAVDVFSDSRYVVETINGRFKIHANQELWKKIFDEKKKFRNIRFLWVKGHANNKHNCDVDRAAVEAAGKGKK